MEFLNKILLASILFFILLVMVIPGMAFAHHTDAGNEDKSAFLFSIAGNNVALSEAVRDSYAKYMADNNGVTHLTAYNYMDIDYTYKTAKDNGKYCDEVFDYLSMDYYKCVKHSYPSNIGARAYDSQGNDIGLVEYYWDHIKNEFANAFDSSPMNTTTDRNAKILLVGVSLGGGSATYIADDDRNSNVNFDVIWLLDPVGSGASRDGIIHECSMSPGVLCGANAAHRSFPSNVKNVVVGYQMQWAWPADFLTKFEVGNGHELRPSSLIQYEKHTCNNAPGCHSEVNSASPGKAKVDYIINSMNKKPILDVPEIIDIRLGQSFEVKAYDILTGYDNNAKLKFRLAPETPLELEPMTVSVETHMEMTSPWMSISDPESSKDLSALEFWGQSSLQGFGPSPHVLRIADDNTLKQTWQEYGDWRDWTSLGGSDLKKFSVSKSEGGMGEIFAIDNKNKVHHKWSNAGWEELSDPGFAKEAASVTTFGSSGLLTYHVFVIDANDEIKHKWRNANGYNWSDWESLGGSAQQIVVTSSLGNDPEILLSIIDSNGEVLQQTGNSGTGFSDYFNWSGWQSLSDPGFAKQIAASGSEIFVIDYQDAIQQKIGISFVQNVLEATAQFKPTHKGSYNLELIVEYNGWPCDNCTDGSNGGPDADTNDVGEDDARGALGRWDIKPITLIVRGSDDDPEDPLTPFNPENPESPLTLKIPSWVKFIAEMWSKGVIGDAEFADAIRYLIDQKVILIPDLPEAGQNDKDEIPQWIKFNAEQWYRGIISDSEFVSGIKWIIENGIINLK